jgi:uncharacterized protein YdeI (YjbR/CyaY-like superfamily)
LTLETVEAGDAVAWRSWLRKNHLNSPGVWLIFRRKGSSQPSISYDEAMDEALAYGWIDSIIRKLDAQRYARKFTPRRPGSTWSTSNIERVNRLTKEKRITKWGLEAFEKRTSEISLLEKFKANPVPVPDDMVQALRKNETARVNFEQFTPSCKQRYVMWITSAKQPETRQRRIDEAVVLISQNVKTLLK